MPGPFDEETGLFKVLVNDEGQYSLWPAGTAVPGGWLVRLDDAHRDDCVAYVEEHWTDMRPRSLADSHDA
ncbi:MbtH family protein [Streptosporangium sp. NPDC001559]|uniref:MbtH family protein n=1 Tax=Streptosporangium sp. NPDC001559 TaxID=3366187 RepID=UPI0036E24F17